MIQKIEVVLRNFLINTYIETLIQITNLTDPTTELTEKENYW